MNKSQTIRKPFLYDADDSWPVATINPESNTQLLFKQADND